MIPYDANQTQSAQMSKTQAQESLSQNTLINSGSSQRESYTRITQQSMYPKRDQAIVLDSIEGVPISEYAVAIAKKIDGNDIR